MPTFPSHHGRAATHSTTSWPSFASWGSKGCRFTPPELPRPRKSTVSAA